MNNKKNYYETLKVSPLASPSAIKKSYQKLARIHHPDKNPNNPKAAETFKQINEAYQILSDTFKRKNFDRQMKQEKDKEEEKNKKPFTPMYESYHSYSTFDGRPPNSPSPTSPHSPFKENASTQGATAQPTPPHKKDPFSIKNFKTYLKQSFSSPEDQVFIPLEISLEEAATGCKKNIALRVTRKGVTQPESFQVYIPPGTKEKEKIKIKNTNENLHVSVIYKAHPLFSIKGENILMNLPVPFTKAFLGGEIEIPTLRGRVSFQLPSGTHSGHTIQLKGQGFPLMASSKKRGNMLITVLIDIPPNLSEEEKGWIKKIHGKNYLCPKVAEFDIKTKLLLKNRKT